ncbi:MAG: hypothetical protein GKC10_01460 [Methanosarcinales archaeon]|nr:hypothetical protein [Methanosarcinales archaeon]
MARLLEGRKRGREKMGIGGWMAGGDGTGGEGALKAARPSDLPVPFLELVAAREILGEIFDLSPGEVEEMIRHRMAERSAT